MLKGKRVSAFLTAIIFAISILSLSLTGCGENKVEPNGTGSTQKATVEAVGTESTQETTVEELTPVKLKWYFPNAPQTAPEPVYEEANKYINEKIKATVDFQPMDYGVMEEKMTVIIASGEDYDICFTSDWLNKYFINAPKNAYKELGTLIDQYAPQLKKDIPERVWKGQLVGGKIYAVPNMQFMVSCPGFAFNKALVDKYKMDLSKVKEYEDLEPLLEIIKKNEPKVFGLDRIYNMAGMTPDNVENQVAGLFNVDKNLKVWPYDVADERMKASIPLNISWIKKGYVLDLNSQKNFTAYQKEGKIFAWWATIHPGIEIEQKAALGYDIVVVPMGNPQLDTHSTVCTMNAVGINSKNPERAMMLINLVNTDKYLYNLLSFGIENKNYKKISDNRIELIKDSGYKAANWALGSVFNSYLLPGQVDDIWEQTKKLNESGLAANTLGFVFDREPVKAELAAVEAIQGQYTNLEYATDIDFFAKWDEMNKKEKEVGMDVIQAEVQKQLDAWKASNEVK